MYCSDRPTPGHPRTPHAHPVTTAIPCSQGSQGVRTRENNNGAQDTNSTAASPCSQGHSWVFDNKLDYKGTMEMAMTRPTMGMTTNNKDNEGTAMPTGWGL